MEGKFKKKGTKWGPTLEHKRMFTGMSRREGPRGGSVFRDAMSNLYRKWFVQGQADYRAGNRIPVECIGNASITEAWNMGWQCDAAVEARGLRLSDLGLFTPPPDLDELDLEEVNDED